MTDWKALCRELVTAIETNCKEHLISHDLNCAYIKADTALAKPEPEWPTDEETEQMFAADTNGFQILPLRTESVEPSAYRLARYRTSGGAVHLKLQGAYRWTEGTNGGCEWRDIPTVDLDDD